MLRFYYFLDHQMSNNYFESSATATIFEFSNTYFGETDEDLREHDSTLKSSENSQLLSGALDCEL